MDDNNQELIKKEIEHLSNNIEKFMDSNRDDHNRFLKRLGEINNFQINQPQKCGKKFIPLWVLVFLVVGIATSFGYILNFHAGG